MSIYDQCKFPTASPEESQNLGRMLSSTICKKPVVVSVSGELGAGKTTLVRGLAEGLGIQGPIVSPSFSLQQEYGEALRHIDLYRLSDVDAERFLETVSETHAITVIEWPERSKSLRGDILIRIEERSTNEREILFEFRDIRIPSEEEITSWIHDVNLPENVVRHMHAVARVTAILADTLLQRGVLLRKSAVRAAALTHDLLRFVDFVSWQGEKKISAETLKRWDELKRQFGSPHELAGTRFLEEKGYPEIGAMIRPHRGYDEDHDQPTELRTIEQKLLTYADKRVRFDEIVSIDERFDDFLDRYGKGKETTTTKKWRTAMLRLEQELFGNAVPPLP